MQETRARSVSKMGLDFRTELMFYTILLVLEVNVKDVRGESKKMKQGNKVGHEKVKMSCQKRLNSRY